jgi:hypothetical protein
VAAAEAIMHAPRVLMVALCRWLARDGATQPGAWMRAWLRSVEGLGRLPTCEFTGHFVAIVARKRS